MASRSLGELMLRPSSLARIPHAHMTTQTRPWICHRSFSQSLNRPAESGRNDGNGEYYVPEQEAQRPLVRYTKIESAEPQPRPQGQPQPTQAETTRTIDSLFSGMPTNRTPPPYMPQNAAPASQANHVFGAEFSNASRSRPSLRSRGLAFDDMALPDSLLDPNLSNKPSDAANLAVQQEQTFSSYPRLNPTYGRTIELDAKRGRDIVRGIGMLGSLMARNKVKSDFNRQRFHERGGLKRKRLASERWRARFKEGFKQVTGRVTELTRKGW